MKWGNVVFASGGQGAKFSWTPEMGPRSTAPWWKCEGKALILNMLQSLKDGES